ncbi:MAG: tyrosine-type recombinase/integrase [Candidatus Melainabacteria bacterium]|jgi:integrase/recombinase XerD
MNNNLNNSTPSKVSQKALKANLQNERIKHKYFNFLKESQGFTEATITAIKKSIYRYEEFSDFEDFSKFNQKKAVAFKNWIEKKEDSRSGKQISLTTCYHYLKHLKDFFKWIAFQAGYKSKICLTDVEYLKLPKDKARIAIDSKRERFPTLEQVKKVVSSIEINSEIDLRDRALISFTLLSGMRDSAITSLPIGCFDEELLQVNQSPKMGVKTKFSKAMRTYIFKFDEEMMNYILDWVKHLKVEKLFGNADPLFPRSKVENLEGSKVFACGELEPKFWQSVSSMRDIFKQRFEAVGVEYFPPHSFRHLAVKLSLSKCKNGHEFKAVSQNFGHENIGTTMITYGSLNNSQVGEVIGEMNFGDDKDTQDDELIDEIKELLNRKKKGKF